MNHVGVFLNTRVEDSGALAWIGDKGLMPVRYLFDGKTIQIKPGNPETNKYKQFDISFCPSFHKEYDLGTNIIKTAVAIALLVPGLFLATFKGLAFLSADVRRNHFLTVKNLTQADIDIDDPQKWKEELKQNALKHFSKIQQTETKEQIEMDLSLTAEQEKILGEVIKDLNAGKRNQAPVYGNTGFMVFSTPEIPGRIFKLYEHGRTVTHGSRIDGTNKAREVIQSEGLNLLHVPAQKLIQIEIDGNQREVLMEQKFDILHGYDNQRSIFQYCVSDPELKPFIQECARQLVILILKTGYMDVRYDNNPVMTNGQGLALVDLNTQSSVLCGLRSGCAQPFDHGILSCLPLEMLENFESLLKKELSEEHFNQFDLDGLKEKKCIEATRKKLFSEYLKYHNISTGNEQVNLKGWGIIKTNHSEFTLDLQDRVNQYALKNLGLIPIEERKFYIYKEPKVDSLDKLKKEGKIFDWMNPKNENSYAYGYYVWC